MGREPNGTLIDWRDLATGDKWDTLLLGNGMSINIWEPFGYAKLYDHAKSRELSAEERRLFGIRFGSPVSGRATMALLDDVPTAAPRLLHVARIPHPDPLIEACSW